MSSFTASETSSAIVLAKSVLRPSLPLFASSISFCIVFSTSSVLDMDVSISASSGLTCVMGSLRSAKIPPGLSSILRETVASRVISSFCLTSTDVSPFGMDLSLTRIRVTSLVSPTSLWGTEFSDCTTSSEIVSVSISSAFSPSTNAFTASSIWILVPDHGPILGSSSVGRSGWFFSAKTPSGLSTMLTETIASTM